MVGITNPDKAVDEREKAVALKHNVHNVLRRMQIETHK